MRTAAKAAAALLVGAAAALTLTAPASASPSCQLCVVIEDAARSEYRSSSGVIYDLGYMRFEVTSGLYASSPITIPYTVEFTSTASTADVSLSSYSGTATIQEDTYRTYITVPIVQDTLSENNEYFYVKLGDPSGNFYAEDAVGVGTILDDDPAKVSVINARAVGEYNSALKFNVRLSRPLTTSVTVWYTTQNGSADGTDYYPESGVLTFAAGETSKVVDVAIKDDDVYHEADESVYLKLTSVSGAPVADSLGYGLIEDNDFIG
ncbi:Calx-beta domain-containing protein [Actinokineospora soli]|uniref:Calx-beta domain-containing protein n=1 Tax=Actinokineospora soli TaxID=1048753 RepID=A0ABW2TN78_9PSEU